MVPCLQISLPEFRMYLQTFLCFVLIIDFNLRGLTKVLTSIRATRTIQHNFLAERS
jgi:hypothetical protein